MMDDHVSKRLFRKVFYGLCVSLIGNIFFVFLCITLYFGAGYRIAKHSDFRPVPATVKKFPQQLSACIAAMRESREEELVALVSDESVVSHGYRRCDIALSVLIEKYQYALEPLIQSQERVTFADCVLYPGVNADELCAIRHFLHTEQFPYTAEGLFVRAQKYPENVLLWQTFQMTPEYMVMETLLCREYRQGFFVPIDALKDLLISGSWNSIHSQCIRAKTHANFSEDEQASVLLSYLNEGSVPVAHILATRGYPYIEAYLDDQQVVALLSLLTKDTQHHLAQVLLQSPRSSAVLKKCQELVCIASNDVVLQVPHHEVYVVQEGDSLWKISKKFHADIEAIKKENALLSDALRPGAVLKIPQK